MGCWDIFCFICGNTCHSFDRYASIDFVNTIKYCIENPKSKLAKLEKKYVDIYNKDPKFINKINDFIKFTQWMDKCTILTANNDVVHNCTEVSCNITFNDNKGNEYIHNPNNMYGYTNLLNSIFIHTDCWKFIYKKYKIKLKYSDLAITSTKNYHKIFDFIDYGEIEKYWSQNFEFLDVLIDKKEYLCSSPLLNNKNISQIKKNFNKLKIKTHRKGPTPSASFYNEGVYKIGVNNNIWQIKHKKWLESNDQIIKISKNINITELVKNKKLLKYIKFIGEYNIKPIFISHIIKKNNKTNYIEFVMIKSFEDEFNKLFL